MDYKVNFTNELKQPNNTITIPAGGTNNDLSITLSGSAAIEYSMDIQQSLLQIMENFAHSQEPNRSTEGQLWYDNSTGILKVATVTTPYVPGSPPTEEVLTYTPVEFMHIDSVEPSSTKLWYDTLNSLIKVYNGTNYVPVMENYLQLSGGTINGDLFVSNASTPIEMNIGNELSADSLITVDITSNSNLSLGTNIPITMSDDDELILSNSSNVATLKHNQSVAVCVGSSGEFDVVDNSETSLFSVNNVTEFHSGNLSISSISNSNVAPGTNNSDAMNRSQYNSLESLVPVGDFLFKDLSNNMIGPLSTYDLTINPTNSSQPALISMEPLGSNESIRVNTNGYFVMQRSNVANYTFNSNSNTHSLHNNRVTNVATPVASSDAVNQNYLISKVQEVENNPTHKRRARAYGRLSQSGTNLVITGSHNVSFIQVASSSSFRAYFTQPIADPIVVFSVRDLPWSGQSASWSLYDTSYNTTTLSDVELDFVTTNWIKFTTTQTNFSFGGLPLGNGATKFGMIGSNRLLTPPTIEFVVYSGQ